MNRAAIYGAFLLTACRLHGQIQVDIKLARLQYIAHEPVIATVGITNLAGRDIDLQDSDEQAWFGFEITGAEDQPIAASNHASGWSSPLLNPSPSRIANAPGAPDCVRSPRPSNRRSHIRRPLRKRFRGGRGSSTWTPL